MFMLLGKEKYIDFFSIVLKLLNDSLLIQLFFGGGGGFNVKKSLTKYREKLWILFLHLKLQV